MYRARSFYGKYIGTLHSMYSWDGKLMDSDIKISWKKIKASLKVLILCTLIFHHNFSWNWNISIRIITSSFSKLNYIRIQRMSSSSLGSRRRSYLFESTNLDWIDWMSMDIASHSYVSVNLYLGKTILTRKKLKRNSRRSNEIVGRRRHGTTPSSMLYAEETWLPPLIYNPFNVLSTRGGSPTFLLPLRLERWQKLGSKVNHRSRSTDDLQLGAREEEAFNHATPIDHTKEAIISNEHQRISRWNSEGPERPVERFEADPSDFQRSTRSWAALYPACTILCTHAYDI